MEIIKHGNSEQYKRIKHFICLNCGCRCDADITEYEVRQCEYSGAAEYILRCPDCGMTSREIKYPLD